MIKKVKVEKEVNIRTLSVKAGARYWEDATVDGVEDELGDLIPCRDGDYWCPEIDVDSGIIRNWEIGKEADIHYKCCDDGTYTLRDEAGNVIAELDGYVPCIMCPQGGGYGDYIIMQVSKEGKIANWHVAGIDDFLDED